MKISDRVDKLEILIEKHIEESGYIKTDLAWLKKAFWTLVGIAGTDLAARMFHK